MKRSDPLPLMIMLLLIIGIMTTSLLVVYYKHVSRQLFADLQSVHKLRHELHIEWTQLLLEQGAWGSDARVEKIARHKLNMHLPSSDKIIVSRE
jgi:cell division protein FtsL